ncbi:UDP-N-acetylmuramoyl-L-alanyl-D-glutamate--2,6-diaminopimelate ligase [Jeotgalibacillus sp. R-1-5s-1]|uniref:UDP-N-acetylmuramoyl-L-alanyl-D-glutamate--2, 6-diaminopimelate ligase n=1 Tax=Jeotgalibacillus sp. R-1-5s-1 TaxID=2555897 RepID=UPI00106BD238|nr:UDP-N-acetylmuramoyl-L-alanyl-D-glutamate--2,6-diaminopimelate ligase [Jeotgalibacillus sp. R-1-5s-1]TFD98392.1 UDP-N-acetylmuramoyl-L-alanyl-D-glutamate--2,6-diaminopimelate ligase [Jeotgalibacillus sp. R-1-5s-1]
MVIDFTEINMKINHIFNSRKQEISGISFDSRRTQVNHAFFCLKGEVADGHEFIDEAIKNGAVLIVGTDFSKLQEASLKNLTSTFVVVGDDRTALADFSMHFYQHAHNKLKTIAVTGTNGKTTVAAFVKSLFTQSGIPTGSIGTTGIFSSREEIVYKKSTPTTPEAPDLHKIFHNLRERKDQAAVMEVSSIAVDQKRVEGIEFDVAIHTNLSLEHLEYHKTFEHYKMSKMKLFDQTKKAVVNIDDDHMGGDLASAFKGDLITYSLDRHSGADLIADNCHVTEEGTSFELLVNGQSYLVRSSVYGNYNVQNLLAAIGAGLHAGLSLESMLPHLSRIENPKGRFQVVEQYGNRKIIIDYAHTPVALNSLLEEVKKLPHRRLIVMIAGIGIRDFGKMPKMAETVEGKADEIIVTVDHPGDHDPQKVVDQVMTGFRYPDNPSINTSLTRKEGVLKSLSLSDEGDVIILSSGCINGAQIVKGEYIPHSDEDIIQSYFKHHVPAKKKKVYRTEKTTTS